MLKVGSAHAGSDAQQQQIEIDSLRFGIPAELLREAIGCDEGSETFGVWPEHREVVELFMACATQWRVIDGVRGTRFAGLDYTGVDVAMRMYGIRGQRRREVFEGVQIMEVSAMEVLNCG